MFGFEPLDTKLANQVLTQKIVKGFPSLRRVEGAADRDHAMAGDFAGDDWAAEALLLFALLAAGFGTAFGARKLLVTVGPSALGPRWVGMDAAVAMLILLAAAARARLIATSCSHDCKCSMIRDSFAR